MYQLINPRRDENYDLSRTYYVIAFKDGDSTMRNLATGEVKAFIAPKYGFNQYCASFMVSIHDNFQPVTVINKLIAEGGFQTLQELINSNH